jgi:hypothetical protein
MKSYNVVINGNPPSYILKIANAYNGKPVNKDTFFCLDNDISFIVCDCKDAHGNTSNDKTAWLNDRNDGNTWSIKFSIAK